MEQFGDSGSERLKGYIMGINNALGMDPVEVTFTMDNVSLDFESSIRPLNLTLDLSKVEPALVRMYI